MKRFLEFCLMEVHIGQEIRNKYEQSGLKMKEFAKRMNYGTKNLYNVFKRPHLDTEIVKKASEVLHYDFFSLLSRELSAETNMVSEPILEYNTKVDNLKKMVLEQIKTERQIVEEIEKLKSSAK